MFLSDEQISEIDDLFKPPIQVEYIDPKGETKKMDSFYELEDYIKDYIYDKKYPGLLNKTQSKININDIPKEYENKVNEDIDKKELSKNNSNKNIQQKPKENKIIEKKYKIPNSNDAPIKFDTNYSTDDKDEYDAITLLNEDRKEGNEFGWTICVDKEKVKTFYKIIKMENDEGKSVDSVIFYVDAIIDYSSETISKLINDVEFRRKFDHLFKQAKILKEENKENNIKIIDLYLFMKMPFIFTDRDFVVTKKIWSDYNGKKNCTLINLHSILNDEYPPKDKPVRAEFVNRSAYICPITDNQCKFYMATCIDMKMSLSPTMMVKKGGEGQEKWVNEFIAAVKKYS